VVCIGRGECRGRVSRQQLTKTGGWGKRWVGLGKAIGDTQDGEIW
jgi:hypothetical protein